MLTRTTITILIVIILLGINCANGQSLAAQESGSVVVVVNPQSASTDVLSSAQLRRIFTMRQSSWPNGKPIKVFVLHKSDAIHDAFTKSVLQLFPYQLERVWNKLVFSGLADKPTEVDSASQMAEAIASHVNAIGYLPVELVGNLKVVKIGEQQ